MTQILLIKAYIDALGYKSSASLKTSRPRRLPLWGKEYGPAIKIAEFKDYVRRLGYRSWSPVFYKVMLDVKTTKIINIPGMLQHFAIGVYQTEWTWPHFLCYQVWSDPFWFQISGGLCASIAVTLGLQHQYLLFYLFVPPSLRLILIGLQSLRLY
jgi:hypothetical protein